MSSHYESSHYGASHYLSSHFGRTGVTPPVPPITPEPTYPPGMGEAEQLRHRRILQEDELLIALVTAFLDVKDNDGG